MNLIETPEIVTVPETHYLYVEVPGPFMETARKAWMELREQLPVISQDNGITGSMSLYTLEPMIYRAGVTVSTAPVHVPEKLEYTLFKGGKYSQFLLTGSYSQLPDACGRVFEIVEELAIQVADNFFIELYFNNPDTTPEEELKTGILVPTV